VHDFECKSEALPKPYGAKRARLVSRYFCLVSGGDNAQLTVSPGGSSLRPRRWPPHDRLRMLPGCKSAIRTTASGPLSALSQALSQVLQRHASAAFELQVDLSVAHPPHQIRLSSAQYNYGSVPNATAVRNRINALFKEH
jgi:hypothetical protein